MDTKTKRTNGFARVQSGVRSKSLSPNLVVYVLNCTASSALWEHNPETLYKQDGPQIMFPLVKLIEVCRV